jgi:2-amino-4-hydroxy-6-hydroxymethyldihydropteridine diphosphokinase
MVQATVFAEFAKRGDVVSMSELAIVAIGSNLGDSRALVLRAMDALEELAEKPLLRSSLYETAPVDCPAGSPNFVNAVVAFEPRGNETPESLLKQLQALEKQFGRQSKKVLNESRPLDLDLITFGNRTSNTPDLVLPHPRAHLRRFVLEPLSEIAPHFVLHGQTKDIASLIHELR